MRVRYLAVLFGLFFTASSAMAAPPDGTWAGSVDTPNGKVDVSFTFKAEGSALTGSTTGPDGAPAPIKNGKVSGDKISFTVDLDIGMPVTLAYEGVVAGDQISMKIDFMGMPFEFVVKKK